MATSVTSRRSSATYGELGVDEGRAQFDSAARRLLGVSGAEFLSKWDRGEYKGQDSNALATLALLIPFGRP